MDGETTETTDQAENVIQDTASNGLITTTDDCHAEADGHSTSVNADANE